MNAQSIIPPNIDYGKISADKYDPNETYEEGELRIQYNTLWKAKQAISVPEPWTPDHWEPTTLAAEFSALNSSIGKYVLDNVERMRFQITSDNRVLLWFYTDSQNENGFRIDFTSSPKQIQFRLVTGGSSEIIGIVQMK